MSFVTTQPEALTAAAGSLQGIGSALAAENAAAALPTTGVVPAAADAVSAQQAAIFSAYGSQYQSIAAQAQAIHEAFVNLLGTSAGSYGATEAANATAAGLSGSGFSIIGQLTQFGQFGLVPGALTNGSLIALLQGNMFGAATSDFLSMMPLAASSTGASETAGAAGLGLGSLGGTALQGAVGPAGPAIASAAPVLTGLGSASSVGGLSVAPSWVGEAAPVVSATPASLAGAGWTAAAPHGTPVTALPAGMPSVATAGKAAGFGVPRYGVKPTVMPKPAVV